MYLDNIPSAAMYEKSFMHRDVVTQVSVTRFYLTDTLPRGWHSHNYVVYVDLGLDFD